MSSSNPKGGEKSKRTWGSVYNSALSRGLDHGYAAFLADGWEKRQARQGKGDLTEATDFAKKLRDSLPLLESDLSFSREHAANWEKNCKDAYAAQERADRELDALAELARDVSNRCNVEKLSQIPDEYERVLRENDRLRAAIVERIAAAKDDEVQS